MNTTHTDVTVTARGPLGGKDFSFLIHPQGGEQIYINFYHLQRAGFERSELKEGVTLVIDYLEQPDGKRSTQRVRRLGKKLAERGVAKERRRAPKNAPVLLPLGTKAEGQLKFYDDRKGYGFITCEGADYFFHTSKVADDIDDDELVPGAHFSFEVGEGKQGRVVALNLQRATKTSRVAA